MLYKYNITVTSSYDLETFEYLGIVSGDNYEEAVIKLESYFKSEIDEFSLKLISPDDFLMLEKDREELYSDLVKAIEEDAIW
nr:MAG TPA: hypothetical protein [Caudoviricetes sp.]